MQFSISPKDLIPRHQDPGLGPVESAVASAGMSVVHRYRTSLVVEGGEAGAALLAQQFPDWVVEPVQQSEKTDVLHSTLAHLAAEFPDGTRSIAIVPLWAMPAGVTGLSAEVTALGMELLRAFKIVAVAYLVSKPPTAEFIAEIERAGLTAVAVPGLHDRSMELTPELEADVQLGLQHRLMGARNHLPAPADVDAARAVAQKSDCLPDLSAVEVKQVLR